MRIGILGSGDVGRALANGFQQHGYEIRIGTRSPEKHSGSEADPAGRIVGFADAAAFGEILVLAVRGTAARSALDMASAENLRGKIVIDATNPIGDTPPENGVLRFFTTLDSSLMEELQAAYPKARFVKAFNSVGNALMVNPDFGGVTPTMFICGDDADAKQVVSEILARFGFEAEDMGGALSARAIEPLCILWCIPGFLRGQWTHAFKLLKQ